MTRSDWVSIEQLRAKHDIYIKVYIYMLEEGVCSRAADERAKEAVMHMERYMT